MTKVIHVFALIMLMMVCNHTAANSQFDLETDTTHQRLYKNFLNSYNSTDKEKEFYKSLEELCEFYRERNLKLNYYKMQLNACLYETENNHTDKALKRANNMLTEMEAEKFDAYSQVYLALGTIYENRGNYSLAQHYYEIAIENLPHEDKNSEMAIYSRLSYLLMFQNPVDAKHWNDLYYQQSLTYPEYHQVYLFLEAFINFTVGNKYDFKKSYAAYNSYHEQNEKLDNYGKEALQMADLAFDGKYDEALKLLENNQTNDLNLLGNYDARICIYKMMKRYDLALQTSMQRAQCVDSLSSDMIFSNLNELNTQAGLARAKSKASKEHERMLTIVVVFSVIIIIMLILIALHFSRLRVQLRNKNEQLKTALVMAEEGEKMKSEFVRSVSHEIRTPLNAISGFNDILNSSRFDISDEERKQLLERIQENVKAITEIVDDMLRVADKESNEFYPKLNKIYCNQFLSSQLYKHREHVSGAIELNFTTKVVNRFQIETNEDGLTKVLEQLIQNAIKFTKEGRIELHCEFAQGGKSIEISLSDTGRGINKEQQDKIFESFYKGDSFEQGIGLGLTVSKKIARKLGGELTLDKNYNEGARFVLTLPIE